MSGQLLNQYNILGLSPATVAMILEAILQQGGSKDALVRVFQNRELDNQIQFRVPDLNIEIVNPTDPVPSEIINAVLGVYQPGTKRIVARYFKSRLDSLKFRTLMHPSAICASTAVLGDGSFINANVTIAPYAVLGSHVTLNRNASIGHHTTLNNYCTVNPGAHIAGHCQIGEGVAIGMGALVADGVSIGTGSVIGAGSVVVRDIPAGVKAFGAPCKVISEL